MRRYLLLMIPTGLAGWFLFAELRNSVPEGYRSKAQWADLHNFQYELDSLPVTKVTIESRGDQAFLKIPASQSSGTGVVILLNAEADPYYKQMPDGPYWLSEAELEKVEDSGLASETVLAVLSSHVDPNRPASPR